MESGKRAIETLVAAKAVCSLDVQMHMSCTGITKKMADDLLVEAMDADIRSILVLRGDPAPGKSDWEPVADGFKNASELVSYIRHKYGDFFSLSVAGHPGKHPASSSKEEDLEHLKQKVGCGADFIITQMTFKASEYQEFVGSCRRVGIDCPIIPGVLMIPPSLEKLRAVCNHCSVEVPEDLVELLETCGSDKEKVREAGRVYMQRVCSEMLSSGAPGLYMYTLNLEKSAQEIVTNLNLKVLDAGMSDSAVRPLPFPRPREKETVRPIFWASNAISYLTRTRNWSADFPSQWGQVNNEKSKAGDHSFVYDPLPSGDEDNILYSHHSIVGRRLGSMAERRNMWGESPSTEEDVFDVFERFVRGFVPRLPWCDRLEKETLASGILKPLATLNHYGYLTINSQPRVNGAPSEDEQFGWGPRGGHVYQKAYLEFFCSPGNLDRLLEALGSHPSISLEAFNVNGGRRCVWTDSLGQRNKTDEANVNDDRHISAVTWGVFDGSEVTVPSPLPTLHLIFSFYRSSNPPSWTPSAFRFGARKRWTCGRVCGPPSTPSDQNPEA
uniref:MTHFR SAM-binding regulatory domain-containing protein n=2 Tax=Guillardia theta TaxID=55529 RepID=A0A7S4UE63_GUITH